MDFMAGLRVNTALMTLEDSKHLLETLCNNSLPLLSVLVHSDPRSEPRRPFWKRPHVDATRSLWGFMDAANLCTFFKCFLCGIIKGYWGKGSAHRGEQHEYMYLWMRRRMNVLLICTCNLSGSSRITTQQGNMRTRLTSPQNCSSSSSLPHQCNGANAEETNERGACGHIVWEACRRSEKQLFSHMTHFSTNCLVMQGCYRTTVWQHHSRN